MPIYDKEEDAKESQREEWDKIDIKLFILSRFVLL